MKLLNTNTIEIKKSKFVAYLYDIDEISEIKEILKNIKYEHKKAKHIVYINNPTLNQGMFKVGLFISYHLLFLSS